MDDRQRTNDALLKHAVVGSLLHEELKRGELKKRLQELADRTVYDTQGRARRLPWRTLEDWYYELRGKGFEGLRRKPRKDRGTTKALSPELVELVLDLKREDPGRSAPLIYRQLELAGELEPGQGSVSTIQRVLKRRGLSGPAVEVVRRERFRFEAEKANTLWQGDALHGPKLVNPQTKRLETVKIFALIDDRSRLIVNLIAGFSESEAAFLALLYGAVARCGCPRTLYLDNGASFVGRDLRLVCAKLGIHLVHSAPYESSSRGKVERFWRTLRAQVLDRLQGDRVKTLADLQVRLASWLETEYNVRPHASLSARAPRAVWEADEASVRFLDDPSALDELFRVETERHVRNDSTVSLLGVTYETPGHLRRQKVTLRYSVVTPGRVWVVDGSTEVALKPVEPTVNLTRRRHTLPVGSRQPAGRPTGLNPVEQILARATGRALPRRRGGEGR